MLERIETMIQKDKSFAFETTLSGLTYLQLIEKARTKGFEIVLFFVFLESVELAINRVAIRVSKGGHNIPPETIKRRYIKGLKNFKHYSEKVNSWHIYDNSSYMYQLVANNVDGIEEIYNFEVYKLVAKQ